MARTRFINHQGKQLLFIDFSNVNHEQAVAEAAAAKDIVRTQAKNSLLVLTDIGGAAFEPKVVQLMKDFTDFNRPYVRASAVVGATGLRRALVYAVSTFVKRELRVFDSVEEAKDWLVKF